MRVCTVCHEPVPSGMPVCPRDGAPADDPNDTESMVGQMIGEYRLKGIVGEGGMGQVYEGVQPVIGKRVAIKLLRRELATDKTEAQRLLAEARTVNAIGHRGIIDIFSFGALPDGRQYFVMEYLSGVSLSRHIKTYGALPVEDALRLLDEMAAALGAAHAAGVIHRDFKPSNIFLVSQPDGSSFVKLLDFGIAKQAPYSRGETPQTRVSRVMGTPEFMAPEQARGQSVGPRTDLYALGVVAFELLTGRLPFDADNPFEIVNKHLNEPAPAPSSVVADVPPEVDTLVLWLLEKNAADRPASAEAVRDELKHIRKTLNLHATRLILAPESMTQAGTMPVLDEVEPPSRPAAAETREAPRSVRTRAAAQSDSDFTQPDGRPDGPAETRQLGPTGSSGEQTRIIETPMSGPFEAGEASGTVSDAALRRSRLPLFAAGAAALVLLSAVVGWLAWRTPADSSAAAGGDAERPAQVPRDGPTPGEPPPADAPTRPAPTEPKPPPDEPTAADAPRRPKADALTARYRRVQTEWRRSRAGRSPEDRRIFDLMLDQVGKQVAAGKRAEATEGLNDFVQGALGGREP